MDKYIKGGVVNFDTNNMSKYAEQLANELMQFYSNIDIDSEDYLSEDDFRVLGYAIDTLNDYSVYLAKKEVANSGDFYTKKRLFKRGLLRESNSCP